MIMRNLILHPEGKNDFLESISKGICVDILIALHRRRHKCLQMCLQVCASADSAPEPVLSPHLIDNLLLELKQANCSCLKKYGLSYLLIR